MLGLRLPLTAVSSFYESLPHLHPASREVKRRSSIRDHKVAGDLARSDEQGPRVAL